LVRQPIERVVVLGDSGGVIRARRRDPSPVLFPGEPSPKVVVVVRRWLAVVYAAVPLKKKEVCVWDVNIFFVFIFNESSCFLSRFFSRKLPPKKKENEARKQVIEITRANAHVRPV